MSETTTEPAITDPAAEPAGTTEPEEGEREGRGASAEAARYRTQLRAAEAQRDALAERVGAFQRREVERVAAERLAVPGDLFDVGRAELADLLDEAGDVDPERVGALVADLLDARPGLAKGVQAPRLDLGQGRRESAPGGASWKEFLQSRN